MAEGAPKGNSSVPRGVAAMVAAKKGGGRYPIRAAAGTLKGRRQRRPNKGGGSGDPIRAAAAATQ